MIRTFLKRSLFAIEEPTQILTKHTKETCVKYPDKVCPECCERHKNKFSATPQGAVYNDKDNKLACWLEDQEEKQRS